MNNLFLKIWITLGSFILMVVVSFLIILVYVVKFIIRIFVSDSDNNTSDPPFHDSRRHPINKLKSIASGRDFFTLCKSALAILLIGIAVGIILNDAYKIKYGWMHPETAVWSVKYLSDSKYEKIGLSFSPEELKKTFWWVQKIDWESKRVLSALFQLIDIKFRTWLFQYIPPNPSVSLSWLFGLFFIPLLLFRFLRRYIKLGVISSAVVTVSFLASPATVGYTFQNLHHGKPLAVFFMLLILNITMMFDDLNVSQDGKHNKKFGVSILFGVTLFLALFTDPLIYAVFLLLPIFFPKLFYCHLISLTKKQFGMEKICNVWTLYIFVVIGYILSVFYIIPHIAEWAGYPIRPYSAGGALGGQFPRIGRLFNLKLFVNMYWFVIGNVGLWKYLPLYVDGLMTFGRYTLIINYASVATFSLFNIILVASCIIIYRFFSQNRPILAAIIALYATMGWISFIHSFADVYHPWGNYFYGSIFSVTFAILLATILASFARHKKIYVIIMIVILISSFFTYSQSKEINKLWKYSRYPEIDIDAFYHVYKKEWYAVKNGKALESHLCEIDPELRSYFKGLVNTAHRSYGILLRCIAFDMDNSMKFNFAAFCSDLDIPKVASAKQETKKDYFISYGRLNYDVPSEFRKINLLSEQLKVSSSSETKQQAIDGKKEVFWHVKFPRQEKDVFIEFDMGQEMKVGMVRVYPREESVPQFWDGGGAFWAGSNDGQTWEAIAILYVVDVSKLNPDGEWVTFLLPNKTPKFRFYRLNIVDPYFLALAEIELFN